MVSKALSLTQPYAELIKNGSKHIETRSWRTNYRGLLYIHASKTKPVVNEELIRLIGGGNLDFGKIVCSCRLADCVLMTEEYVENMKTNNYQEYICGIYEPGRYAWILEDVKPLDEPVTAKGHLGLWNI